MTPLLLSTVLLDPPSTLIFGSVLAVLSGKLIRKNPQSALKKTVVVSAVWSAWYGLCVGWFFFERPDWMFVYLMDTQKIPLVPAFLAFWLVVIAYGMFGALGTGLLMQQGRTGVALATAAGAVLSMGFIFAITANAYVHVGTYAQYVKAEAPALEADAAMKMAMNLSGAGIVVGIVVALGMLILDHKKARAA
jgi:exosortase/archaeosortase